MQWVLIISMFKPLKDYKKNENKIVKVEEILGADVARKAVSDAMVRCPLAALHSLNMEDTAVPHRKQYTFGKCTCARSFS